MAQRKNAPQKPLISLWQYLFVILIIILPAGGFYGGIQYQQERDRVHSAPQQPDTLVIIRLEDKQDNLPPLTKTITDKEKVIELYNEIINLPDMPNSTYKCPIEFSIEYALTFFQDSKQVFTATINPTGCRIIQIANGKTRWAAQSSGQIFINDLQRNLGLSEKDFYGEKRN